MARISVLCLFPVSVVPAGITVAAVLLGQYDDHFCNSAAEGDKCAPYCLMGVCFESLVEIDGAKNRQACLEPVYEGMNVKRRYAVTDEKKMKNKYDAIVIGAGPAGLAEIKAIIRCSMGPCQGRMCSSAVFELIAEGSSIPPEKIRQHRLRPPIKPVSLQELANAKVGETDESRCTHSRWQYDGLFHRYRTCAERQISHYL